MNKPSIEFAKLKRYRPIFGKRRTLLSGIVIAGILAWLSLSHLGSSYSSSTGAWSLALEFFKSAFSPALQYQSNNAISPDTPLLLQALKAANLSLAIATTAISIAVIIALPLAYLITKEALGNPSKTFINLSKPIKGLSSILRVTHEIIWAVVILILFGFTPIAAIIAIALTATGTLTKIYSEILIESDTEVLEALRANGASFPSQFIFGLLPLALADLLAYTLYQLECAVRSSAAMGVLGIPTLGYFILQSHENLYFNEVWTYLYSLVSMVVFFELWSKAICSRLRTNDYCLPN